MTSSRPDSESEWWCPVEFKLLWPLEVVVDGEPRDLGSPGEKAVLALLLLAVAAGALLGDR